MFYWKWPKRLPTDIEHVTDALEISSCGVMGGAALVVNGNGEVKAAGSVSPKIKIIDWLKNGKK